MSKKTKKRGKKHLEGRLKTLSPVPTTRKRLPRYQRCPDARPGGQWVPGIVSLGAPVGIGVLHPLLGELIATVDVVVVLTIIGTALFGSQALSERAFRLLRWIGNRSEPLRPRPTILTPTGTWALQPAIGTSPLVPAVRLTSVTRAAMEKSTQLAGPSGTPANPQQPQIMAHYL